LVNSIGATGCFGFNPSYSLHSWDSQTGMV